MGLEVRDIIAGARPHDILERKCVPAMYIEVRKMKLTILKILFILFAVFLCHCVTTPSQQEGGRYMLDPEGRSVSQPVP